jgi:hypothetical protein
MKNSMIKELLMPIGVIQPGGIPALRVAVTIAVVLLVVGGLFIVHKRHQFFDADPTVENDVPAVRSRFRLGRSDRGHDRHFVRCLDRMIEPPK